MCQDMHDPCWENPENYHWKRACCIRRSCCFVLKSTEKCWNCIIFLFFSHMFAVLSESWKIRCIFLQEKHVISIRKKVRKLLFLLHMAKHGPTVLCFQCFCSIFLCWTWISQNWFAKHGHLSSKNAWNALFSFFC